MYCFVSVNVIIKIIYNRVSVDYGSLFAYGLWKRHLTKIIKHTISDLNVYHRRKLYKNINATT